MNQKRYPEGHFHGIGIGIGIPLGFAIGLALGNIALGAAIGVAIGIPLGVAIERNQNPNPIALTREQRRIKTRNLAIALIGGVILLIAGSAVFFLNL